MSKVAESGLRALKEKTSGLASMKDMAADLRVLKSSLSQVDTKSRETGETLARELEKTRKSMESRFAEMNEDQVSQFKKEFDYIAKNIDSIRNISSDIKIFSSRLGDIERLARTGVSKDDFSKTVELIDTKISDLGVMAKSTTTELSDDLESFKKTVSDRFNEGKGSQLKEFRNEIQRISSLEKEFGTYERITENRLKELSDDFSALQALPTEFGSLKEKIGSLDELSGSIVSRRDFSQRVGQIDSSIRNLQSGLGALDKKIGSHSSQLESAINEALSEDKMLKKRQRGFESMMDSRIADLEKRISKGMEELSRDVSHNSSVASDAMSRFSELGDLSDQADENNAAIDDLKERLGSMELTSKSVGDKASAIDGMLKRLAKVEALSHNILSNSDFLRNLDTKYADIGALMKTLPMTVDKHTNAISKILESKDFLAETVASLRSDIKGMGEVLASSQERIIGIEKGTSADGRVRETRLDELSKSVEAMRARMEAGSNEAKDFREYMTEHVNDIMNSYEKRFGEFTKDLSSIESGKLGKTLSELVHLKDKIGELDILTKDLSRKAVPEHEFVETVRSISKRIDDIENLYSVIDKNTALHGADLDAAVSKALTKEKLMEVSHARVRDMFEKRMTSIEKRLSGDMSSQITRLREDMAGLKALEEHLDSNVMSKVSESMVNFSKLGDKAEKRMDALTSEMKSMNNRIMDQQANGAAMDQKLKSALSKQESMVRELLRKERLNVNDEINDETAKLMKDAEIGELKRKQEFENLLRQFQELHVKTQQNLDDVTKQRGSFLDLERSLRERVDKHKDSIQARVAASQGMLKKRLTESESMNMKLNNMVSELQMNLEKERNTSMDFDHTMSGLREDLIDRMKTNEDMFDSEMDAFRNRIDTLTTKLNDSGPRPDGASSPHVEELRVISKSLESMGSRLQDNRNDMKKFKEYVTGYINNLVKTYEGRMGRIRDRIEDKFDGT